MTIDGVGKPDPSIGPAVPPGDQLRVSTQERERVAAYLATALTGGRLTSVEFAERSQACHEATIYAELAVLLVDLTPDPRQIISPQASLIPRSPAGPLVHPDLDREQVSHIGPTGLDTRIGGSAHGSVVDFAFFGDTVRNGPWTVPPKYYTFAQFGDNLLDLREARFSEPLTKIQCFTMFGDVEIIVPPDITIQLTGFGVFGSVGGLSQTGPPGCPVVTVTGYALFGDVTARLKTKKEQRQLRRQERRQRKNLGN